MPDVLENQPEMDPSSPEFQEILKTIDPGAVSTGVKEEATPSPEVVTDKVDEPKEDESPAGLKAQIRGLKAELTRRSGNADKVEVLEDQLQSLQEQLKTINEKPAPVAKDEVQEAISKLTEKDIVSKLTDWQDELADARAKYVKYEDTGEDTKLQQAANRIQHAKRVISALHEANITQRELKVKQAEEMKVEADSINTELTDMYDAVNEVFPDFTNPETELWKAGNEEFLKHPKLMARMGPAGEVVAAAMAIIRNQDLTGGSKAKARRDVLSKIDKGLGKALQGGAASPSTGRVPDYGAALTSGEALANFDEYINQIKAGNK